MSAFRKSAQDNNSFGRHFILGRTYLDANMVGEATSEFEKQEMNYSDEERLTFAGANIYYYLGIAYEKSGSTDKAIAEYEEFLDVLKDADTKIPEVVDARQRLAQLKRKHRQ